MNCRNCGAPINEKDLTLSEEFRPITMWGYFGYEILFSIPLVGFILLIVFSTGGTRNVNLKNFARSYFCYYIIVLVIVSILAAILAGTGIFAALASGVQ